MRALALEHLRPNPIGVYGDVLDGRGIAVDRILLIKERRFRIGGSMTFSSSWAPGSTWDDEAHP